MNQLNLTQSDPNVVNIHVNGMNIRLLFEMTPVAEIKTETNTIDGICEEPCAEPSPIHAGSSSVSGQSSIEHSHSACAEIPETLEIPIPWSELWTKETFDDPTHLGNLNYIKTAYVNEYPLHKWMCAAAAKHGDLEMLKWLYNHGCQWDESTCIGAMWTNSKGRTVKQRIADNAKDLEILKYARDHGCPLTSSVFEMAIKCNRTIMFDILHAKHCPWTEDLATTAASVGQCNILEWVHEHKLAINWDACAVAAVQNRHLSVLRMIYVANVTDVSITFNTDIIVAAARYGRVYILKWILDTTGCMYGSDLICSTAAKYSQLPVLKWARSLNFPWDERVCAEAALAGHLNILKWARKNGCNWDHRVRENAVDHPNVLKWAKANGAPNPQID
jgi:hypothetical protein